MDEKGDSLVLDNGIGMHAPHVELERQMSNIEQEALDRKIKLGKANEFVIGMINNCNRSGAKYLDLSKKNLNCIPEELLSLSHVEVRANVHNGNDNGYDMYYVTCSRWHMLAIHDH